MFTINLAQPIEKTYTIGSIEKTMMVESVKVLAIIDNALNTVIAKVIVYGNNNTAMKPLDLILWKDASYEAINNWTQEQANARILELI